jgi:hypothetical protein
MFLPAGLVDGHHGVEWPGPLDVQHQFLHLARAEQRLFDDDAVSGE